MNTTIVIAKVVTAMGIFALCSTLQAERSALDGTKFRTIEEGSWYHPIELDTWTYIGGREEEITMALENVERATGERRNPKQPDTIIEYGAGNWIYEFVAVGDKALTEGDSAGSAGEKYDAYRAAATYYHIASAPHTNAKNSVSALDKAGEAYAKAAQLLPGRFEIVDIEFQDDTFGAYLHVPAGQGPFPTLVMSNGSDMAKETNLGYYATHLQPKGIAFLTLDTPGMGDSRAYDVQDGETDKLHAAAVAWTQEHADLDAHNVFVQGVSFGGNAAARLFLSRSGLDVAGVVSICSPLDSIFLAPADVYESFPEFTIDGVKTRLGLSPEDSITVLLERIAILSLDKQGLLAGDLISTPLLAINTNDDPVAPMDEMDRLLARAEHATRIVFDLPGHCPPRDTREAIASAWILDQVR